MSDGAKGYIPDPRINEAEQKQIEESIRGGKPICAAERETNPDEKKPRLFYYEEAVDGWIPAPERVDEIIDLGNLDADEGIKIQFRRCDMTDEEFDNLPEGD